MTERASALSSFQKVTKSVPIRSANLRDPSGIKINPSGIAQCNTEASHDILSTLDQLSKSLTKVGMEWLVNLKNREVAGQLVETDTPGATPIRRLGNGTYVLYMHSVFAEYPSLRPISKITVPMTIHNDPDGTYIKLQLNMALSSSRTQRKAAADVARAQEQVASTKEPGQ